MNNLKKITAFVLALMIVVSLAACNDQNEDESQSDKSIVGNWNHELVYRDYIDKVYQKDQSSIDPKLQVFYDELYKAFDNFKLDVVLELKDDGTFTFSPDDESVKAAVEKVKENLKTVIPNALKAIGITDEQIKARGISVDDMVSNINEGIDNFNYSGEYFYKDNKLYLYDEGKEKNDSQYLDIELDDNEFIVKKINGDVKGFQGLDALLPITFKKV